MLVISAGFPRSSSLQLFNWMISILESHRAVHFYNGRYIDFYHDPRYVIGDTDERFEIISRLTKTGLLTHIVFKTHALPRYVFDQIEPHDQILCVYTVRNIKKALRSLLGLWSCPPDINGDEILEKCWHQMDMNMRSLIAVHDKSLIWYFDDINSDKKAHLRKLADMMEVEVSDAVLDWILQRTSRESMAQMSETMPLWWWETYHDIAHFHLGEDKMKTDALLGRLPELLDRLSPLIETVRRTTGIDLLAI